MAKWQVGIKVKKRFKPYPDIRHLRRIIYGILEAEEAPSPLEASLLITDDEDVHRLNQRYRGVDHTTDVLAFALKENKVPDCPGNNIELPFVLPQDGVHHLGEVIISYPQAQKQAEEAKTSIDAEMTRLLVHGFLHLFGYDHESPAERKRMRAKERRMLKNLANKIKA